MGILDFIQNIFGNNKKLTANIHTQGLSKVYGEKAALEIGVFDGKIPLGGRDVHIYLNGKDYTRVTDHDGICKLNINLEPGEYTALIEFSDDEYNAVKAFTKVIVKAITHMEGTDVNMIFKDGTKYQCAVYDDKGRVAGDVDIRVNGMTYRKTQDAQGLYSLNINLAPGTYDVSAKYIGDKLHAPSEIVNTIVVNQKPEPKVEVTPAQAAKHKLHSYLTQSGGGKLGQICGYSCGPHALMQAIYRLTGIELSESKLMSVCGTTTNGTSHAGLSTGLAWFNREYGFNIKMEWKNFSEVGWNKLQEYIDNGAVFCHLLYRSQWGHYEIPQNGAIPMTILNSLGEYCSYPAYCGYKETRSRAIQQSYINGISQKSIAILTI